MAKAKLTAKQEFFVKEYIVSLNATQAAIRAGYSEKTAFAIGHENLSKPNIAAAIENELQKRSKRTEITADHVLESVYSTMERCKQAEPVVDREGNPVMVETKSGQMAPAYTFNAMGVYKGAEMLGKHLGMFVDRVDTKQTVTVVIDKDDAEL